MTIRSFLRLCTHIQMLPVLENGEETTLVGGQAVMEGVMMRAPHSYCVAVRKSNGEIVTQEAPLPKISEKYPIFKLPLLRGLGTLGHAMYLGVKALQFSANVALEEEGKAAEKPAELKGWMMAVPLAFSLLFFLFMYKFVPLLLATEIGKAVPAMHGRLAINLMDGVIRLAIFLAFLYGLSRMKDIRRMFEFHGAEHKVVFNFESGQPVNVENAQKFVTWHPRCGTSFLLLVMVVAILVYSVLPFDGFVAKLISRIALLPLIIGISYEMIRYAAKHRRGLMAALTTPGLWLQRITTQPPSNDQAAVAVHALEGAMELEKAQGGELVIA
ncbi:MAG TPA: DUF1385 domain-containing protein [Bryobacteraceae bacterium]|nr:DUF1385 domain-containing protein [Bryobacteraceae bacterium]